MTILFALLAAAASAALLVTPPPPDRRLVGVGHPSAAGGQPHPGAAAPRRRSRTRSRPGCDGRRGRSASIPGGAAWPGPGTPWLVTPLARTVMAAVAGLGVMVAVGGMPGVLGGAAIGSLLPRWLARLPDPSVSAAERRLSADLPLALDLMASCLAAGAPVTAAAAAVGSELRGPLGRVFCDVARQLELGAPPAAAWRGAAGMRPLQALVESVTRVGDSGAALGPALRRLAEDERDRAGQAQQAAVRRVGVFVVIPLGICFLPAFLLLGVVPIVAGLVGGLLI